MTARLLALVALAAPALAAQAPRARAAAAAAPTVAVAGEKGIAAGTVDSTSAPDALGFRREIYVYDRAERRDPFVSLMTTGVLRPVISDLALVGVAYSPDGGRSIAVFRDKQTKEQYRVRTGETLGRMRVARIEPKRVTFSIDEFGFNRQESITMGDTTRVALTSTTPR